MRALVEGRDRWWGEGGGGGGGGTAADWVAAQVPAAVAAPWAAGRPLPPAAAAAADGAAAGGQLGWRAVRQLRWHLAAGACLGLGLRHAGTADPDVRAALMAWAGEALALRDRERDPRRPAGPLLEQCLGAIFLALAAVLAGTGDAAALALVRAARARVRGPGVGYGGHLALALAAGLLFLGGGHYSLSRSDESIAALVIALYPRFPSYSTDNQYHLQALRHLYALAAEDRSLEVLDARTGRPLRLPVEVLLRDGRRLQRTAPCLLPELRTIREVRAASPHHRPAAWAPPPTPGRRAAAAAAAGPARLRVLARPAVAAAAAEGEGGGAAGGAEAGGAGAGEGLLSSEDQRVLDYLSLLEEGAPPSATEEEGGLGPIRRALRSRAAAAVVRGGGGGGPPPLPPGAAAPRLRLEGLLATRRGGAQGGGGRGAWLEAEQLRLILAFYQEGSPLLRKLLPSRCSSHFGVHHTGAVEGSDEAEREGLSKIDDEEDTLLPKNSLYAILSSTFFLSSSAS